MDAITLKGTAQFQIQSVRAQLKEGPLSLSTLFQVTLSDLGNRDFEIVTKQVSLAALREGFPEQLGSSGVADFEFAGSEYQVDVKNGINFLVANPLPSSTELSGSRGILSFDQFMTCTAEAGDLTVFNAAVFKPAEFNAEEAPRNPERKWPAGLTVSRLIGAGAIAALLLAGVAYYAWPTRS